MLNTQNKMLNLLFVTTLFASVAILGMKDEFGNIIEEQADHWVKYKDAKYDGIGDLLEGNEKGAMKNYQKYNENKFDYKYGLFLGEQTGKDYANYKGENAKGDMDLLTGNFGGAMNHYDKANDAQLKMYRDGANNVIDDAVYVGDSTVDGLKYVGTNVGKGLEYVGTNISKDAVELGSGMGNIIKDVDVGMGEIGSGLGKMINSVPKDDCDLCSFICNNLCNNQ